MGRRATNQLKTNIIDSLLGKILNFYLSEIDCFHSRENLYSEFWQSFGTLQENKNVDSKLCISS